MSAHVSWLSIKPTTCRKVRFPLLPTLRYTGQVTPIKKNFFMLKTILMFWECFQKDSVAHMHGHGMDVNEGLLLHGAYL